MADPKTVKCRICGEADSLKAGYYRGPWGHFLRDGLNGEVHEGWDCCYDCWVTSWALSHDRPPSRREYLLALAASGAKQAEIAHELGISVRTVKNEYARLRKKLRKS